MSGEESWRDMTSKATGVCQCMHVLVLLSKSTLHVCTHVDVTCAFTHACILSTFHFVEETKFTIISQCGIVQVFMRVCFCLPAERPYCTAACVTPRLRSALIQCCPRFLSAKLKLCCLAWHAARCGVFQLARRWNWNW